MLADSIDVVLTDDHHIVRSGITSELARHSDINVVGEASSGQETLRLIERLRPQVLVLDINLPDINGFEVVRRMKAQLQAPLPKVLALSAFDDQAYVQGMLELGVSGYLLKDEPIKRISEGIRRLMGGQPVLSKQIQRSVITTRQRHPNRLTSREVEVLKLLAHGRSDPEIANALRIATNTVRNHVSNIYCKIPAIHTRAEAAAWAWQNNLVQLSAVG